MYDDHEDPSEDSNLSLPSYFITCFNFRQLPKYQAAIAQYAAINPNHRLEIDLSGEWNSLKSPALLCYDRGDLGKFWRIFETIEA